MFPHVGHSWRGSLRPPNKNPKRMKASAISTLISLTIVGTASAAISVVNTQSGSFDATTGTGTVSYTLASPGNTLVFGTYADADYSLVGATYNGVAADGTVQNSRTSLAYFHNAGTSASFVHSFGSASANTAYFIYELSGVDTAAPVATGSGQTIATGADNQYIVNFLGVNNGPSDDATVNPFSTSVVDKDGWADANSGIGGGSVAAGSGLGGVAGSQQVGWNGGWQWGEVSVGFTAVPEPSSSMVLLGAFALPALVRRRRA